MTHTTKRRLHLSMLLGLAFLITTGLGFLATVGMARAMAGPSPASYGLPPQGIDALDVYGREDALDRPNDAQACMAKPVQVPR
jgi:hypothetical protein